jgi:hypothetical protein
MHEHGERLFLDNEIAMKRYGSLYERQREKAMLWKWTIKNPSKLFRRRKVKSRLKETFCETLAYAHYSR